MTARALFTRSFISFLLLLPIFFLSNANIQAQPASPPLLTYSELVQLYEEPQPSPELANKLNRLLTIPFVSNTAGLRPVSATSVSSIRVATWNIERGLEFDALKAALTNDQRFFRRLPATERPSNFNLAQVLEQARELSQADIVVLNEVDWGLKRTNYRNVVRDLAAATRMNYAFGVEFVEVDPLNLGIEKLEGETSESKDEMLRNLAVDKSRTLGLHGTAILSRFPLRNVRIVRFVNQG
ncbi:MAG TPA: endonuclease/exonuclease/phosphatase family protein, partial [Pyrinomonadaceae bacterium]|nr:endonuclease/exonuclease/phosphatase family protein [Pyrinomonadaceae bacterium]